MCLFGGGGSGCLGGRRRSEAVAGKRDREGGRPASSTRVQRVSVSNACRGYSSLEMEQQEENGAIRFRSVV